MSELVSSLPLCVVLVQGAGLQLVCVYIFIISCEVCPTVTLVITKLQSAPSYNLPALST